MKIRAINIRQPWAWFITRLPPELRKDVENRSWRLRDESGAPYVGPLAIVASATCTREEYEDACGCAVTYANVPLEMLPEYEDLELGGLVGVTHVAGYIDPAEDVGNAWHAEGRVGWRLERSAPVPLRRVRGKQGPFWVELTEEEVALLNPAAPAA